MGGRSTLYASPTASTTQKFTGKERDAESGLDYFGARYLSSPQGRWTTADWSETPQPIPYADLSDPQTLNLYGYVRNNPLKYRDLDGHVVGVDDLLLGGIILTSVVSTYVSTPAGQESVRAAGRLLDLVVTKVTGALSNLVSREGKVEPYEVGTHQDLKDRSVKGDGLDIHHVPQQQPAGQIIEGYDPKTAPAIAIPRGEHLKIPTDRGEARRTPRDQLAKDVKDLRKTEAPKPQIKKAIEKNKQQYPEMRKPEKPPEANQ